MYTVHMSSKYQRKRLPLELPEPEHKALRQMALDTGVSATQIIRECLAKCHPELGIDAPPGKERERG